MNRNILISGYGGQGVLTLAQLVSLASLKAGFKVKQSELHGLAQRGGSLQAHVRISDQEIYSPLISKGEVDLILAMDLLEGWRSQDYANKNQTTSLVNNNIFWPYQKNKISSKKAKAEIEKHSKTLILTDADKIVKGLTGSKRSVNVYLFAQAIQGKLLPFDSQVGWQTIEDKLKGKALEENRKVFDQGLK